MLSQQPGASLSRDVNTCCEERTTDDERQPQAFSASPSLYMYLMAGL
jgi:hypothetical protein